MNRIALRPFRTTTLSSSQYAQVLLYSYPKQSAVFRSSPSIRHASTQVKETSPPRDRTAPLPPSTKTSFIKSSATPSRTASRTSSHPTPTSTPGKYFPGPKQTPPSIEITDSAVNGPISTLPAPLELPTRGPDQSAFKHYLATGKAYMTFYKTGVKNIYANYKSARDLQSRLAGRNLLPPSKALMSGHLTRSEFQLLERNSHDMRRVPIFALVLLICGEFTPLVVLALTGVVPWTCRIPKQITGDREKLEKRRSISFRNLTALPPKEAGVERLNRMQLIHISWSLGLSSSVWDYLGGQYPGLPTFIVQRKVATRMEYLKLDDMALGAIQGKGVELLSKEEVIMACVERGIDVLGKSDRALRAEMCAWLANAQTVPRERLLLTRPNVWPGASKSSEVTGS